MNEDKLFTRDSLHRISGDANAFERYRAFAWPSPKEDSWKYSSPAIFDYSKLPAFAPAKPGVDVEGCKVSFEPLRAAWVPNDKLEHVADAFSSTFLKIVVPKDSVARATLRFTPSASLAGAIQIDVGEGAALDYAEDWTSKKAVFSGFKTWFNLARGAKLKHSALQRFAPGSFSLALKEYHLAAASTTNSVHAELGSSFSRLKIDQHFDGDGSASENKALFFGSNAEHFDITTNAFHHARNTKSDIVAKGALKGNSSAVYRGLIKIDKTGSGTDSYLQDRVLHLSKGVKSNSIPSLLIDNNDVHASHGATTSRLDENALFYLRSRGLPRSEAERLVVEGFLGGVAAGSRFKNDVAKLVAEKAV
ncbi:hypothetical protein AUJ14_01940 [Candidatus Micrarchaeota archaeon CG1_02_55_22]|nr:MAG: hypothetical protein AUJ14_01940 [Candidatus Micrarchaeota archaeon CG1_02_55_22]